MLTYTQYSTDYHMAVQAIEVMWDNVGYWERDKYENFYEIIHGMRSGGDHRKRGILTVDVNMDNGRIVYTMEREGRDPIQREVKLAKFLREFVAPVYNVVLSDRSVEQFFNHWQAAIKGIKDADNPDYRIVDGWEIAEAYDATISPYAGAALHNSCMNGYSEYLGIYIHNPDVCQLVVQYDDEGRLLARALLWTDINGQQHLDRVYGSDKAQAAMQLWAQQQGIKPRLFDYGSYTAAYECTVKINNADFDSYPYVDSLFYLTMNHDGSGYLRGRYTSGALKMHYTDGDIEGATRCYECNRLSPSDDVTYTRYHGYLCESCYDDRYVACWDCEGTIERDDAHCHEDGNYYCDGCVPTEPCEVCGDSSGEQEPYEDGNYYCWSCYTDRRCNSCYEFVGREVRYCDTCATTCRTCSDQVIDIDTADNWIDRRPKCEACHAATCQRCDVKLHGTIETSATTCWRCIPTPQLDVTIAEAYRFAGQQLALM